MLIRHSYILSLCLFFFFAHFPHSLLPALLLTLTFTSISVEATSPLSKELVKLLKTCSDGYPHIQRTLQLEHFLPLFRYLSNDTKRDMAIYLLEVVGQKDARLDNIDLVRGVGMGLSVGVKW